MNESWFPKTMGGALEKGKGPGQLVSVTMVDRQVYGGTDGEMEKKIRFEFMLDIGNTLSIEATPKLGNKTKPSKLRSILEWLTDSAVPMEALKDGEFLQKFLQSFVGKRFTLYWEPNEKGTWTNITSFRPIEEIKLDSDDIPF